MNPSQLYLSTIDPLAGDIARREGLGVEIAEFCTAINADDLFEETNASVARQIMGVPRRILHGPFNELFPCAIDPLARKLAAYRYAQALSLAQRYGARKLVLHGGYSPRLYFPCWYEEQSIVFWKEFLDTHPGDYEICLENVMEETPESLLRIVTQVDDPRLRLCLDVGHANAELSRTPVMEWVEACRPYLRHLHLHNNAGGGDLHDPLKRGTIPVEQVLHALAREEHLTYTLETLQAEENVRWLLERGFLTL